LFLLAGFALSLAAGRPIAVATGQIDSPSNAAGLSDLVQFTLPEVQALKAGQSVSKLLASSNDHEIAVAGAGWIKATMAEGVQAMKGIEHLEHGNGFLVNQAHQQSSSPGGLLCLGAAGGRCP
jgi:hypothetical protein